MNRSFHEILRKIDFETKLKPNLQHSDGSAKANRDIGTDWAMLEIAERFDTIVGSCCRRHRTGD